jgi:opacity protein-like surface antigen
MIVAGPAPAADYYGSTGGYGGYKDPPMTAPVTNWAGFYLGPSFGWSWSRVNAANNALILTNTGSVPFSHPGTNGMIGGGQLGYNVQSANFVYGIEADFGGLDVGANGSRTDINSGKTFSVTSKAGFYGDVTGRAGVTVGNALLYVKGGFAFFTGNVHITETPDNINQDSGMFTGWTAGGGIEYKLSRTLTVKAEYLYFDVDNTNFSCCIASAAGKIDDNITSNTMRLGLNYYLNDLRSPLD